MTIDYPVNQPFFHLNSSMHELQKGQTPAKLNPEVPFLLLSLEKMVEEMIQSILKQLKEVPEGNSKDSTQHSSEMQKTMVGIFQAFKIVIKAVFHFVMGEKSQTLPHELFSKSAPVSKFQKEEEHFNPYHPAVKNEKVPETTKTVISLPHSEVKEPQTSKVEIQSKGLFAENNPNPTISAKGEKVGAQQREKPVQIANQQDRDEKTENWPLSRNQTALEKPNTPQDSAILEKGEAKTSQPPSIEKMQQQGKSSPSSHFAQLSEQKFQSLENSAQKNPVQMANIFVGSAPQAPQENVLIQPNMTPQINLFAKSDVAIERRSKRKKKRKKRPFDEFREDLEK